MYQEPRRSALILIFHPPSSSFPSLPQRKIGILHVVDGLAFGFHKLGEPMTLAEFRKVLPAETTLMGNCGYTAETAEAAIESGNADTISFGRPYLGNPDLVERFANGWPLADPPSYDAWYSYADWYSTPKGYSDLPAYKAE